MVQVTANMRISGPRPVSHQEQGVLKGDCSSLSRLCMQGSGVHRNPHRHPPRADSRALRLRHPLHTQDGVQSGFCSGHERPRQAQRRGAVAERSDPVSVPGPGAMTTNTCHGTYTALTCIQHSAEGSNPFSKGFSALSLQRSALARHVCLVCKACINDCARCSLRRTAETQWLAASVMFIMEDVLLMVSWDKSNVEEQAISHSS